MHTVTKLKLRVYYIFFFNFRTFVKGITSLEVMPFTKSDIEEENIE